ncbi:hypothetical protein Cgig2_017328 [Carnegiea gigantea]|uniref:NAC domain-containing protein n=1 Tax=Carnegiea gigantea TaxID=171969 RepID=A0A9Q1QC71_9CARY|nr:hypothetical protein Cgig2_017328 [Carnegiea gigantea]
MRENMNISVNGQSRVPPGFRFHPTEEELLQYYLRKKVANRKIDLDVIFEVDLNRLEPWDIQERCKIGSTPQNEWYFFSHKDKKYPTGTRTNRATVAGFWKATGRDKVIYSDGKRVGMRKTLVFYKGRAPHGLKSDWIMHEYRLDDTTHSNNDTHVANAMNGEINITQEEGWVVCRIFKKKNLPKSLGSFINTSSSTLTSMLGSPSDHNHDHDHHDQGALEQIFQSMGGKPQKNNMIINTISSFHVDKFMQLPSLESPTIPTEDDVALMPRSGPDPNPVYNLDPGLTDWTALDRFVATHLSGQDTTEIMGYRSIFSPSSSTVHHHHDEIIQLPPLRSPPSTSSENKVYQSCGTLDSSHGGIGNEIIDLWSFTRSSSSSPSLGVDPLCHVSNVGL